jgi:hypothetical protein
MPPDDAGITIARSPVAQRSANRQLTKSGSPLTVLAAVCAEIRRNPRVI